MDQINQKTMYDKEKFIIYKEENESLNKEV